MSDPGGNHRAPGRAQYVGFQRNPQGVDPTYASASDERRSESIPSTSSSSRNGYDPSAISRPPYNDTVTGTATAARRDSERLAGATNSVANERKEHRRRGNRQHSGEDDDSRNKLDRGEDRNDFSELLDCSQHDDRSRLHSWPVMSPPRRPATDYSLQDTQHRSLDPVAQPREHKETRKSSHLTAAETYANNSVKFSTRKAVQDVQLKQCIVTGIAHVDNERYQSERLSGYTEHEREDRHFALVYKEFTFLGVFDGHDGSKASDFVSKQLPHTLVQRLEKDRVYTDKQIQEAMASTFSEIEQKFFTTIDSDIVEKMELQSLIPEGLNSYDAYQQFPDVVQDLSAVSERLAGGTTAALAVIYNGVLYAANVGDSRVLLARYEEDSTNLYCDQLTTDHDCDNKEELKRLEKLGLSVKAISQAGRVGSQQCTRTLGDYSVKGGYKDFDILKNAKSEPVIAEPFVSEGIHLTKCHRFVAVVSDGVYKTYIDANDDRDGANNAICRMINTELGNSHQNVRDVAEQVLQDLIEMHRTAFHKGGNQQCRKRDDMTLLVYNLQASAASVST